MGIAPVHATRRCLERAGWRLDDVDLIEANEAFCRSGDLGWPGTGVG
ncbi:hypothetical protein LNO81_24465 [Klebsiella variicola subsp. variicola]|nr:hypothetical protein [Klebsiella variicola subsp. variicola]